jgi:tRNA threonylcarbamoyladenosine biosynthesis protein TsaE
MLFTNLDMTYEISTTGSEATQAVAGRLAKLLRGGEVIELASDLGGGKTTFVQGLARGLGYDGEVASPTFTLSRVYNVSGGRELHHYDFYRLGDSGIVGSELADNLGDPAIITVIEWAGVVEASLPADRLHINFEVTGDTDRLLKFSSRGPASDRLITGLKA